MRPIANRTLVLALCAALSGAASAEMPTIDDVLLDRTIHGPEVVVDDLRGKVVLLEFWGIT